jgi:hypothetical protein
MIVQPELSDMQLVAVLNRLMSWNSDGRQLGRTHHTRRNQRQCSQDDKQRDHTGLR